MSEAKSPRFKKKMQVCYTRRIVAFPHARKGSGRTVTELTAALTAYLDDYEAKQKILQELEKSSGN